MPLNLHKALFLSCLLTVALSCQAALGELNATTAPPPCAGISSAAECLIAYQQAELEAMADSGMLGASLVSISAKSALKPQNVASCGRQPYTHCSPDPNSPPHCDVYHRGPC
ncbi:hypothetical protein ACJRO7_035563 [Eucalyptus globulus]|uniref:Uncharacterized protein n=1 Tax=Eucalyptus globulus TaxID=34317 RepID=A0ABD3JBH1_EUCGL